VCLVLTVAVTAAYAVTTIQDARRGSFNPRKLATLSVSITFWAYCMLTVDNIIVGLLLWEIFHDVQYNAFVWSYNAGRVERGLARSRLERFLFRKDWRRIAIYVSCIVAYGFLGFFGQDLVSAYQNGEIHGDLWRRVGNVFAASALIHFYLDGFIWKVRDAKVRQDLGMAVSGAEPTRTFGGVRHWAFVTVVFATSFGLAASEHLHGTRTQQEQMHASLVELVPGSAYAHFMHASELKTRGRLDAARAHYLKAIALDREYEFGQALVADLEVRLGDTASAIASYERAYALSPSDPLIIGNLADLYHSAGRLEEAVNLFRTLIALEPGNAQAHFALAFTLLRLHRGLDAKPHLERTLALDSAQPAALNYLGMVEHALGNTAQARRHYETALAQSPEYGHARDNLTVLSATSSKTGTETGTKKAP
jgi:tetratricopeptide (TPR) repeat protein